MLTINAKNVNEALYIGTVMLQENHIEVTPRGAHTIEFPSPVCTTYFNPMERVLFSEARDANPFFHFMESLWILAGRQDVEFVSYFNSNIANYSDDGVTFNGAYGYRLRTHFGMDQINETIYLLKKEPNTRRAVMGIWDPQFDLNKQSKDIPCNDLVVFLKRDGKLNMTVYNRSNDMIWGAYGANAVHFSFLHEYVARAIGAAIGVYNQISNSFHVYDQNNEQWERIKKECKSRGFIDLYEKDPSIKPVPITSGNYHGWRKGWGIELNKFIADVITKHYAPDSYDYKFFREVAYPMFYAWHMRKEGKMTSGQAWHWLDGIMMDCDWKEACLDWLSRRDV